MKTLPFLQRLDQETVDYLNECGVRRTWPKHRCVFRAGEECTGLHIVLSGLVKLYRSNAAGREQIVLLEGEGSAISLAPLMDQGLQHTTAETLKTTTTLFIPGQIVLQLFNDREDIRSAIVVDLSRRLRAVFGLLETIALKPVSARVATRVLELAGAQDALDGSRGFKLLLSQDQVAHVLGTSRESVARALGELRARGVIEQRGAHVRIVDPTALFEWSNTGDHTSNATPLPAAP
jgi:CRP/FNR family transcriptional regulator